MASEIQQAAQHTAGGELARDVYGSVARFFRRPRPQDKAKHRGGTGRARSGVAPRAKNGEAAGKRCRAVVEVGADAGARDREGGALVGREEGASRGRSLSGCRRWSRGARVGLRDLARGIRHLATGGIAAGVAGAAHPSVSPPRFPRSGCRRWSRGARVGLRDFARGHLLRATSGIAAAVLGSIGAH